MARHEHLPIFKKAYELNLEMEILVREFSRYHKYGIGQDLRDTARRILLGIVRANNQSQKVLKCGIRLLFIKQWCIRHTVKQSWH